MYVSDTSAGESFCDDEEDMVELIRALKQIIKEVKRKRRTAANIRRRMDRLRLSILTELLLLGNLARTILIILGVVFLAALS